MLFVVSLIMRLGYFMFIKNNEETWRKKYSRVRKILYLPHFQSDQVLKGNVVNRASPYLHDVSLEITLLVPLITLGVEIHSRDQWDNKSNFKWPSMQRYQCPIYKGTPKSFVWSSTNKIFLWKPFILICGFSAIVTCVFLAYNKDWRNYQD